jgi:hypothetical protein
MSLVKANLSLNHIEEFQFFLNLNKTSLKTGVLPKVKSLKLRFLQEFIVPNRALFRFKGNQLCTTEIGKKLGVNPQTVMNWIKCLVKNRVLLVRDGTWEKGLRSKAYIVNEENEAMVEILNHYNGFNNQKKSNMGQRKKFQMRNRAWSKFNHLTPKPKDIMRLAGSYIGCPEQLVNDLKSNVPMYFLLGPSLMNVHKPLLYEFFRCLRKATKNVNQNSKGLNHYEVPKTFEEFTKSIVLEPHDNLADKEWCTLNILRDIERVKSSCEHPIRKKRFQNYFRAYTWAMKYESDPDYETIEGYAPYHSWERLI